MSLAHTAWHNGQGDRVILGCNLKLTCEAAPEQYDVTAEGEQVGYIRIRGGEVLACYPDAGGDVIWEKRVRGETHLEADERDAVLTGAVQTLFQYHKRSIAPRSGG